jgi:large conductance mechanosensitive channel
MKEFKKEEIINAGKKTKGLIEEFKTFIKRGNVIDLAVGVVIGGAFSKIVSSLVDNIIMPLIGVIIGGIDFSNLSIKVDKATIKYGLFIQNVIDFLIIALCIFFIVKLINKFLNHSKKEEKAPSKTAEVILLEEIRDELKKK